MKVGADKIQAGLGRYIDTEIVGKTDGISKWILGVGGGILSLKAGNLIENLGKNEAVKSLGIFDEENKIDLEMIYSLFKNEAKKSLAKINLPGLGSITLTETDVDDIYKYIREA